ncbi:hypothetical protein [Desulfolutivibrio sulfoxidireducens]|uniref:hypothetical protein n=1 Tax=Desulfolutivibrio sulfoxidireducens TaxID=2773299 RepID=UPI00159D36EE|nr:hypothetical protein [Desulfolutivibrio sulfoxidireducens]QLA21272.1 hypothetical protein GD604_16850 [Desulfolutivibrio sulfoxidireducens]
MREAYFPPVIREHGDTLAAAALRPAAWRELDTLVRLNVNDLDVVSRTVRFDDGRVIVCRRVGGRDLVDIHAPRPRSRPRGEREPSPPPRPVEEGFFYVIPGCVARYDGSGDLVNAIPDGPLSGWTVGTGAAVAILPFEDTGLPDPGVVPETGDERVFDAFRLPGGAASGLLYAPGHIPASGAFALSCLFRLRERLEYDYTFDEKGVLSPVRPYVLQSGDGVDFTWNCPGSLSPVIGFCEPMAHPDWVEEVTYPWSPWNEDFSENTEDVAGIKRVEQSCADAPLLAPDGSAGDPYLDAGGKAYPHPHGFVVGMRFVGLFIADGDRLLAGRISDFATGYGYEPILTGSLELGAWHHAVLSYEKDGTATLFLAVHGQEPDDWKTYAAAQPVGAMDMGQDYPASGVNAGYLVNDKSGERISGFRMNAALDIALPRFFHEALDADQARLLHEEAFCGRYVADECEMAAIAAKGLSPIIIGRSDQ